MFRVGLTGGLASGKSFVGKILEELGCHLVRADELGHAVLAPGGAAYQSVIGQFGRSILDSSGKIDRKRLAAVVFSDPLRLAELNALVHPAVWRLEEQQIAAAEAVDPHGIAVIEAAILIETESYKRFPKLIVVSCRPEQQVERAMKRDHSTEEEVRQRLALQMPLAEKLKYADFVVDTSGSKDDTRVQVTRLHAELQGLTR